MTRLLCRVRAASDLRAERRDDVPDVVGDVDVRVHVEAAEVDVVVVHLDLPECIGGSDARARARACQLGIVTPVKRGRPQLADSTQLLFEWLTLNITITSFFRSPPLFDIMIARR